MKIRKQFIAAFLVLTLGALAVAPVQAQKAQAQKKTKTSKKSTAAVVELPPVPEGAIRVSLVNGSYVVYRFDLPAGAKWSDYNKLTAEYMLDEANLKKPQRSGNHARLMGNYKEEHAKIAGKIRQINLNDFNGPYIIDNAPRKFSDIGAVADTWFTVEYDISGAKAHAQFNKSNLPAASATGPFLLGIGFPGEDGTMKRDAIVQLIRNVTLHHRTNSALNVVSKEAGFEEPVFISYYPENVKYEGPAE